MNRREAQARFCRDVEVRERVGARLRPPQTIDKVKGITLPFPRQHLGPEFYAGFKVQLTTSGEGDLLTRPKLPKLRRDELGVVIRTMRGCHLLQYDGSQIEDTLKHQWGRFTIWKEVAEKYEAEFEEHETRQQRLQW